MCDSSMVWWKALRKTSHGKQVPSSPLQERNDLCSSLVKEISVTKYFPLFDLSVFSIFSWQVRTFGDREIDCHSFCLGKRFLGQVCLWDFLLWNLSLSNGNFSLMKWVSFTQNAILPSPNTCTRKTYSIIPCVARLTPQSCGLDVVCLLQVHVESQSSMWQWCVVGSGRWLTCWNGVIPLF